MTPLFEESRHEPLSQTSWDEGKARETILAIATDTTAAFSEEFLWPIHPMDISPERPESLKPLYYGAAGVIWSLDHLDKAGAIDHSDDYSGFLPALLTSHRDDSVRLSNDTIPGYPIGDAGILLLHFKLDPSEAIADELHRVIRTNANHPARGFVWGGAGLALAALFMFERTTQDRWLDLYLEVVHLLWQSWQPDARQNCFLWTTDLYGRISKRMMALHGFPGIASALLRGRFHLERKQNEVLLSRTLDTIQNTAIRDGDLANWPLEVTDDASQNEPLRVQHCIGAPGIVNSLATYLPRDDQTDSLLIAAGNLTWLAGPLVKPPGLCHGTPGNGMALLKLYERTGHQIWLDRARRFAMHAIEQNGRFTAQHGVRKYSLWTGDLGLAIYLLRCIEGRASIPLLDEF